jgi:endonuclease YncB( thermonuclease family)
MPKSFQAAMILFAMALIPVDVTASYQLMNGEAVEITKAREGEVFQGRIVSTGEKINIRLLGIDCSNSQDRPAARFARKNLVGQIVEVNSENPPIPPAMDQFDRWVVYLSLENGRDFGESLLESGHCTTKTWSMRHPQQQNYESVEQG